MKIINLTQFLKPILVALYLIGAGQVQAASDAGSKVKAAIIFKITRFVHWSDTTSADKVLDLCVLGDKPLYSELKTTEGKQSKGYNIKVQEIVSVQRGGSGCELIFIGSNSDLSTRAMTTLLQKNPVLSVSDRSGFAKEGGMIQIKERAGRIRFTINLRTARASGLDISSQLLGLAKVIQ